MVEAEELDEFEPIEKLDQLGVNRGTRHRTLSCTVVTCGRRLSSRSRAHAPLVTATVLVETTASQLQQAEMTGTVQLCWNDTL